MEERNFIDLFSLQELIRGGVEDALPGKVWVRAEISEIKVKSNGHCYLELSQENDEGLAARANAVIWRSRYAYIGRYFEAATDRQPPFQRAGSPAAGAGDLSSRLGAYPDGG